MVDPESSAVGRTGTTTTAATTTTTMTSAVTTGSSLASRYLDSVSCGRDRDYFSSVASASSSTPDRSYSKQRKSLNESNISSGMTATTAALDISASWSSKGTPSRPTNKTVTRAGNHHHHNSNNSHTTVPTTHRGFAITAPHRPLGIEDDCSSIESSSSHRRSSQPAHVSMDLVDPLNDRSFEIMGEHPESFYYSDCPPAFNGNPSPSRRLQKALEHRARRTLHTSQKTSTTTSQATSTNNANSTSTNHYSHRHHHLEGSTHTEFFPRTTPSTRATPAGHPTRGGVGPLRRSPGSEGVRQRTDGPKTPTMRSRWESKQFADEEEDGYLPPSSDAGAPTEIMTNRASDFLKRIPHSESGAPTEVATNRSADLMRRFHLPKPREPQDPPSVKRWSASPTEETNKKSTNLCLIDAMSTNDESSVRSLERTYTKALFDVHSPSISTSTDNSSKRPSLSETSLEKQQGPTYHGPIDPTQQSDSAGKSSSPPNGDDTIGENTWGRTSPIFGGRRIGPGIRAVAARKLHHTVRGPQMQAKVETEREYDGGDGGATSPVRFFMLEDPMPQPRTPQETSSGEVTSSVSTTDKLLLPSMANEKRATTFIRYNSRTTPNAHEVFQRRGAVDDASDASTISTLDKEQEDGFLSRTNPIQPLFSLDRLDISSYKESPIRKHNRSKSQGAENYYYPAIQRHLRSRSFDGSSGGDLQLGRELRHMTPNELNQLSDSSNASKRFSVRQDSPDPIFCPAGSISFSSQGVDSIGTASNDNEGVFKSKRAARWSAVVSISENSGTGFDTELKHILKSSDGSTSSSCVGAKPPPGRTSTVREKIQAYNRIRPDEWTRHSESMSPNRPESVAHGSIKKDGVNKEETGNNLIWPQEDDCDIGCVKSLKNIFERDFFSRPMVLSDDVNEDNEDAMSVKSLRDKFEGRLVQVQNEEDDGDDRSVRSLLEKFEGKSTKLGHDSNAKDDIDDRSVRSLQKKFEREASKRQPVPYTKGDSDDRSVRSLQKKFEGEPRKRRQPRPEVSNNSSLRNLERKCEGDSLKGHSGHGRVETSDDLSVSSLKKKFEGQPKNGHHSSRGQDDQSDRLVQRKVEGVPIVPHHHDQSGHDDTDDRSVRGLQKKFEGGLMQRRPVQISEDYSDDRSVSSLKKKFEGLPVNRHPGHGGEDDSDDRSVSSLKKKFENELTTRPTGRSGKDESDDRSVSSLKKKFEIGSMIKRQPSDRISSMKSLFESKMVAHGKRARELRNLRAKPTPSWNDVRANILPRGTSNFKAPLSNVTQTRLYQHPGNSSGSHSEQILVTKNQERAARIPIPAMKYLHSPELNDQSIVRHITLKSTQQNETDIVGESGDLDVLSTSSSKVRGPTPTTFLVTRDRLLQFAQPELGQVEATNPQPASRATPPSIQQRLQQWATRYQAQKMHAPVGTFEDKPPKLISNEHVDSRRSDTRDRSNLVEPEQKRFDLRSSFPAVRRPEVEITRSDSASTTKAHFIFEDSASIQHKHMARNDFRGKSGETDDSDGVTLDASIAEVSILTDPTVIKTKESKDIQGLDNMLGTKLILRPSRTPDPPLSSPSHNAVVTRSAISLRHHSEPQDELARISQGSALTEIGQLIQLPRVDGAKSHIAESKNESPGGSDNGWDIEKVSKSFSYDGSLHSVTKSDDSHLFDSDAWPPLDDGPWFDFSTGHVDTNSITAFEREGPTSGHQGIDYSEKGSSDREALKRETKGHNLSTTIPTQDQYQNEQASGHDALAYTYSVDTNAVDINYDVNTPARPLARVARPRVNKDRRSARTIPPGLQSRNQSEYHEAQQKTPKVEGNRIRFFARTHPSSKSPEVEQAISRSERRTLGTYRMAPAMTNDKNQSLPHTTATQKKNIGGLFSRVAWSLSRSSTNDTFVSRLKSVKASRLRRKKSYGTPSSHQPLRDEDEKSSVQGWETAASPPASYSVTRNELMPTTLPSQPIRDRPVSHQDRTPPRRDPPAARKYTIKEIMDMGSIIAAGSKESSPERISRRRMQVHTFNGTSKVTEFFKLDPPRSPLTTPIVPPSSEEIRHLGVGPTPLPHKSPESLPRPIGTSSPLPPREERPALKLAKELGSEFAEKSSELSPRPFGLERPPSFRDRYCEAVARSASISAPPMESPPRVRFQPTQKPPLPPSMQPGRFRSTPTVKHNSVFGAVLYQEEDRTSSSSSSCFSNYFLD